MTIHLEKVPQGDGSCCYDAVLRSDGYVFRFNLRAETERRANDAAYDLAEIITKVGVERCKLLG